LFGVRTVSNGFSSQSEEMKTAYSILQTMTINPFQNLVIHFLAEALEKGGYPDSELYFEQLTPLVILSQTAEETGQTVEQVQEDINEQAESVDVIEDEPSAIDENIETETLGQFSRSNPNFSKNFETYKL
jgi:hypothetical protein